MQHRRNRLTKMQLFRLFLTVVLILSCCIATFIGMQIWEKNQYSSQSDSSINEEDILKTKEITYEGVTYKQKRKVSSYLFIGVDEQGEATGVDSYIGGGQGDVQMVLVVDDLNRTWQILQLNRDSMVEIPVLGVQGNVVSSAFQQLCLAHSYGNGKEESCENNVNTVSTLLDDQPIDGYFAMNMSAIQTLNNLVGGVTVTITSDFSNVDPTLKEGETITLSDQQAEEYIHTRKDVDDETNIARMSRQRSYMDGLMQKLSSFDEDFSLNAYETLQPYTVTDISNGEFSKIINKLQNYTKKDILTIDGDNRVEDDHWAYYLDEDSLQRTIIELYYEEKES